MNGFPDLKRKWFSCSDGREMGEIILLFSYIANLNIIHMEKI